MAGEKVLRYLDRTSSGWLWMKACLLAPIWSWPIVAMVGWLLIRLGDLPMQVGYLLMLFCGIAYFIEDVLKRKIKIGEDYLFFGYKKFKLSDLSSVGLSYRARSPLPVDLIMYFGGGRKLKLKLSRLNSEDFEALLTTIENRFPRCNIDPVVATLTKCKRLARKVSLDEADRIEMNYNSRKALKELHNAFISTAESWMRAGPCLALVLCAPIWVPFIGGLYMSLGYIRDLKMNDLAWRAQLAALAESLNARLMEGVSSAGVAAFNILANPVCAIISTLLLLPVIFFLIRHFCRPNFLVLDPASVTFHMKMFNWSVPISRVQWSDITRGYLLKPSETAGPDKWMINLDCGPNQLPVKLQLHAIQAEDRSRLTKGLERWASHCAIDSELAEALMPRQSRSYTEIWLQSLTAPAERANLDPLAAGQSLQEGRFEVIRRLGIGGQGQAYLSRQAAAGKDRPACDVVLKETIIPVFVEAAIRKQALEGFEQEARILESLDHDSIVKLIDFFIEDHRGYLVLEHIDGRSLRQVIQEQGALPEAKVCELAVQMCDILEYLHGKGVIHRDFTPDNLILNRDGKLKLIDFNVAQVEAEGSSGMVVGKHSYLPPEQFRGKPTTQSDIYAMGATLHYLLVGHDPEPISESSPREVNAAISEMVDAVVRKCTALQASKRALDVDAVRDLLLEKTIHDAAPGATAAKLDLSEPVRARVEAEVDR